MANYQHKRSAIAGKIPLATDLLDGEIAINTKDKKLFSKDDQGVVFEISGESGGVTSPVTSVAGRTGDVVISATDVSPTTDRLWLSQAERLKLSGISSGAEANVVDSVAGKTGDVVLTSEDVQKDAGTLEEWADSTDADLATRGYGYMGDWFLGANVVAGQQWSHNGSEWKAINNGAGEPIEGANWLLINAAKTISTKTSESAQDFIDSFTLKIFQSPTDGLTKIKTRTLLAGEVYEVHKVSDGSLAAISSDKAGDNEIVQDGTSNVSGSDGAVEFFVADGDYYIEVDSNNQTFSVRTPDYTTINLAGWGLKSGDSDIIAKIEEAIAISGVRRVLVPAGDYAQDKKLEVSRGDIEILSEGACNITYNNSLSADGAASVEGNVISEHLLTTSTSRRFKTFLIAGASGIFTVGEDVIISSDALAYPNGRVYDLCYQISRIKSISDDTIVIDDYAEFDYNTADNAVVKKINWLDNVVIDGITFINSDDSTRFGLSMFYCREPVIKNTSMNLFNDAGIELWYCKGGEIHDNAGAITKDESLNYSLAIYGCEGVSVYENSFSSARTAIDISRMSRNCDVYENDVTGNINTHTAHYNTIRNNKVNEGGTLVRGPYNNILSNVYKNSNKVTTLGFNEAGQDGPSTVEDNEWYGPMTARSALYPCGISFNRNKLILTDIQTTSGGDRILYVMHELSNYDNSYVEFSDNELELSSDVDGSQVINTFEELPIVKNLNIKRNISRNFKSGYDLQARSDNVSSSGLTFADNELYGLIDFGVTWRLTDDVDISRNKFYGDSAVGSIAINRKSGGSSVRQGLRLQDNDLDGFDIGIEASGSLDYTDCIETGNKMINVNTKRVNTANFIPYVD